MSDTLIDDWIAISGTESHAQLIDYLYLVSSIMVLQVPHALITLQGFPTYLMAAKRCFQFVFCFTLFFHFIFFPLVVSSRRSGLSEADTLDPGAQVLGARSRSGIYHIPSDSIGQKRPPGS